MILMGDKMISQKNLNLAILTLSLALMALVGKKVLSKPSKPQAVSSLAQTSNQNKSVEKSKSFTPTQSPSVAQKNHREWFDQALAASLHPKASFCSSKTDCPYDLNQMYSYAIQTSTKKGGLRTLASIQRKVKSLDLESHEKADLFRDIFAKTSQQHTGNSSFINRQKSLRLQPNSILMVSSLMNYLRQKPNMYEAIDVVKTSLQKTKDPVMVRLSMNLLIRHFPENHLQIKDIFKQEGLI
jgi:hypothetical protein